MANPVKGEVSFEVDGKPYTFVLGTYGLAALQRRTGTPTHKFFKRSNNDWGIDDMLAVFSAGLMRHHKLTEEEVADLIDALGNMRVGEIIGEGLKLAFPDADGKGGSRPTKLAAVGTGKSS